MSIEKKSLISNRSASKKAIVTKPEVAKLDSTKTKTPAFRTKTPAFRTKTPAFRTKTPAFRIKVDY